MNRVRVIGAGLAGCEAAWQLAVRGIAVELYEMKPLKRSPAHHSDTFAEVVCSNSFKSNDIYNACGLLKEELRRLGSLIIKCADINKVDAGAALAVDREAFSNEVTRAVKNHPLIKTYEQICDDVGEGITVIATGPLTDDALIDGIRRLTGGEFLWFFDAAAPIVAGDSIDLDNAFFASRYDKGDADYLNCPMNREEYEAFWNALVTAETAQVKDFEKKHIFEGCMPVEVMAARGIDTLRFGPLKPVGLTDKRTGVRNHAVLQLRKETSLCDMYNLVGFQTHLTFGEQKRVFSMIPALKCAEFVRYGVMHRNTYIDSPRLLDEFYSLKANRNVYFAGQISGVEGYVESVASGMSAAVAIAQRLKGDAVSFGRRTVIGSLAAYVSDTTVKEFQPMNANFAILEPLAETVKNKADKKRLYAERSLTEIERYINADK